MKKYPRFKPFLGLAPDLHFLIKLFFADICKAQRPETLQSLEKYFQKPVSLYSSFRIGLYTCLKSLNLNPGDEVLLGPINIPDAVNAILISGLTPVFADLNLETHALSLETIQSKISPRTKVILFTYLSGLAVDLVNIKKLCQEKNIFLIEDISQAYGLKTNGLLSGTIGDFGVGSFCVGKTITSTFGGIVIASEQLQKKLSTVSVSIYKNSFYLKLIYLYKHAYFFIINLCTSNFLFSNFIYYLLSVSEKTQKPGPLSALEKIDVFNDENLKQSRKTFPKEFFFTLGSWQCELIAHCLETLDINNGRRQNVIKLFIENLSAASKKNIPAAALSSSETIYYHLPIYCYNLRFEFSLFLYQNGIDVAGYGLNACHREKIFNAFGQPCPNADIIKDHCVFIPLTEQHSAADAAYLAKTVNAFFDRD